MRNLLIILILLTLTPLAEGKNYYRYKDSSGQLVVKDYLPKEAVVVGYQVVNEHGRVLETVPALLTPQQQAVERIKQAQLAEQEEKRKEQRRKDFQLLRQYNTVEDINRAEANQASSLNININIVQSHSKALGNKLVDLQARAANFERKGKPIPKSILSEIEATDKQLAANDKSLEQYRMKIAAIQKSYSEDKVRFKELKAQQIIEQRNAEPGFVSSDVAYSCDNRDTCEKAWQYAQIFAHENASNKLEVVTDTLIITGKPQDENQIGLSITRSPGSDENMKIVLDLNCHNSTKGLQLCSSDQALVIRQKFVDFLAKNSQ